MRCLERNKTDFEYIPPDGISSDLNEDGEHTGEFHPVYAEAIPMRGNISVPSGVVNQAFYGQDVRYTHVLIMDPPKDVALSELGLIRWKGELYDIQAVKPSFNIMNVALRKQTVNHGEPYPDGDD
jgi:hypothetical protein